MSAVSSTPPASEGVEDAVGVDPAGGVPLGRERPVVVALGVRLLELDDRGRPAELAQPGIGIAIVAGRARHAHVADVEAQPDRHAVVVAVGQQVADHRHRRRLPGGRQVLDQQVRQPGPVCHPGQRPERRLELAPERGPPPRIGPVGDAERPDVTAGRDPAERRRPVDGPAEPGRRGLPAGRIGVEQEVVRIGGQPGERRVELEARRPRRGRHPGGIGPAGAIRHQVERVLDEPKPQPVADDRRPVLDQWPALHREAGVDPEPDPHRQPPVLAAALPERSRRTAPERASSR